MVRTGTRSTARTPRQCRTPFDWLIAKTPLWQTQLIRVVGPRNGLILHGPIQQLSWSCPKALIRTASSSCATTNVGGPAANPCAAQDNQTFVANGSWNSVDSSAEFLCHALAVAEPGEGTLRRPLLDFSRAPLPFIARR